jgi:hypothetical protein
MASQALAPTGTRMRNRLPASQQEEDDGLSVEEQPASSQQHSEEEEEGGGTSMREQLLACLLQLSLGEALPGNEPERGAIRVAGC